MQTLTQSDSHATLNQPALPYGPFGVARGGRRERTDEDRTWYSALLSMEHASNNHRAVFQRMAFLASCNPGRLSYEAHSSTARAVGVSTKTVQRAARQLEREGKILCRSVGAGRSTGTYQILERSQNQSSVDKMSMQRGQNVHQSKEGREDQESKTLLGGDGARAQDPATEGGRAQGDEELNPSLFPSPDEPQWENPRQVAMLFSVARKLGREVTVEEARRFEALSVDGRKRVMAPLLTEEGERAARGEVARAPSKPLKHPPRLDVSATRERPRCEGSHRWTPPASDGIANCYDCAEERSVS